jgi:hypothetical protein
VVVRLVEACVGHPHAEADPRRHAEPRREVLQVLPDLRPRWLAPVRSLFGANEQDQTDAGMSQAAPG